MNIFGGDLANIRRTVRALRLDVKNSVTQTQSTINHVILYSRPETGKRLSRAWKSHQAELENVQAELKRLTELAESIEKKNQIRYQE